ncbi:MAG: DUF1571 domain-containing protein [Bacteroidales bacterium]|nr:DUF1571 domain-containing protein [Bacteroidales bacterium]
MRCFWFNYVQKTLLPILLLAYFLIFSAFSPSDHNQAVELLKKLSLNTRQVHSVEMSIQIKERINGDFKTLKSDFKIVSSPFKIYIKEEFPRKGLEVLYVEGQNNGKAWVRPNSFPWTTLSLHPLGNTMRDGQHHSIFKSGFSFFIDIFVHLQQKYSDELNNMLEYNGLVRYNNTICHKITFTNRHFGYKSYVTSEGDNLEKLSYKLKVNDYMIKELNANIHSFDKLDKGLKIVVPNDYGASFIVYIDEKTNLLAGVKVFDDKGLWEEYTYSAIKVNPRFTDKDFNTENPSYNF